jgi:prepilin-type N-terminal cleavage/methylation domain-containing protein
LRSTRSRAWPRSGGFSLIEVVIALAIIGIAIVTVVQSFSQSLRSTRKSAEYTVALIHARSLMDEALATPSIDDIEGTFEFDDGYTAKREVEEVVIEQEQEEEEKGTTAVQEIPFKMYEITVTVKWPPRGSTKLTTKRVIYEEAS